MYNTVYFIYYIGIYCIIYKHNIVGTPLKQIIFTSLTKGKNNVYTKTVF